MAIAHWFVLLVAGSSQPSFVVTPMCLSQDPVVPLHIVSLVEICRGGTQLPQHCFHIPQSEPDVKASPVPDKPGSYNGPAGHRAAF